jgi:3',5'-cyclic AMP phosphodiesterase CpdA
VFILVKIKSKSTVVLCIVCIAMISAFVATHVMQANLRIRIVDPMIGCPQFCRPDETFSITVEYLGTVTADAWDVHAQNNDFPGYPAISLAITTVSGPLNGHYTILARVPAAALPGLYDLHVSCNALGASLDVMEPHALSIYTSMASLRFAHITDPHVTYPDENVTLNLAPPGFPIVEGNRTIDINLRELLQQMAIVRPAFAILTGDIATRGLEEEFQAARQILKEANIPVLCTIGNHDHRSPPSFQYYLAPLYYSRIIGQWRIMILDSGATEGNGLYGEQMRWLEQELEQASIAGQQCFIAMHIPSTTEGISGYTIAGNAEFRALCARYNVRCVLAGHHHVSDAYYANGSRITRPDPFYPETGPLYVKTGSTTLHYGNGYEHLGWRYVRSESNGSLSIGYDNTANGTSNPLANLPLNGLAREDGSLAVTLRNYYRVNFTNITIPVTFATIDHYTPSEGTVIVQEHDSSTTGMLLRVTLPATTNKTITFTKV